MAQKTKSTETVKRYVIKGPKAKAKPVCKIGIPKMELDRLDNYLAEAMKAANDDGVEIKHVRGTLVCF